MESLLWASECFNRSATAANDGWLSPHGILYGSRPPLLLLPFFQPVYHRVPRQRKIDPRARLCYSLNLAMITGTTATNCWMRRQEIYRILARRYVAPSRGAFDTSGNWSQESARCATGRYLRIDANACAHRRRACFRSSTACSCACSNTDAHTRSCANTRINYASTAYANVELPGSDPPAH